jgi:hypothetical protein
MREKGAGGRLGRGGWTGALSQTSYQKAESETGVGCRSFVKEVCSVKKHVGEGFQDGS